MASKRFGHWPLVLGTVLILTGCTQGGGGDEEVRPANAGGSPSRSDVETPDQYNVTAKGLWDGRPSLGGVWVAVSGVTDPRRVLIRNTSNGKSIVGALFRRERENPGPPIQLSSDAAAALGVLAGQPADLYVVALAREAPAETTPPISEETTAAATETAEAGTPAEGAAPAEGSPEAVAAAAAAAVAETGGAPAAVPEDSSPSSFGRRRSAPPAPVPATEGAPGEPAAAGEATVAEPVAVPEDDSPSSFGRRRSGEPAAPADVAATATPGDVSTAPLDATAPPPDATAPPPDATAAAPATEPAALATFIQAGTFSSEANAKAAADALTAGGLTASVRRQGTAASTFWIVLVGPAESRRERNQTLEKVKSLGYPDAFVVRG